MSWWQRLWPGAAPEPGARWVVLDVESSGLDTQRDRLLAIAAIAVQADAQGVRVRLGDSFEVVLRQPDAAAAVPDKANILLHGIGVGAQRGGMPPAKALQAFEQFVAGAPLVAYHAGFDRAMIERACRAALGRCPANPWLDLADLGPVLHPGVKGHALDDWMAHFGIRCAVRHQAAADTLATAELLQRLWPALLRQHPAGSFRGTARLAAQKRWVVQN